MCLGSQDACTFVFLFALQLGAATLLCALDLIGTKVGISLVIGLGYSEICVFLLSLFGSVQPLYLCQTVIFLA